ncbi:Acyl-CoA-binding domain-containing protein 5 [Linnemannia zychae]|nr:Acyl-CoA-binding domain-containing protein 5 [Linnemannia zychae]
MVLAQRRINYRDSSRPSSLFFGFFVLLFISTLYHPFFTHAQLFVPNIVSRSAFARTITRLYVVGGRAQTSGNDTGQFMYLDLNVSFPSTSPAWTKLADGPIRSDFPAAFSPDEKTLYVFRVPDTNSPWQYSINDKLWQEISSTKFGDTNIIGIGAVTDPYTGLIYLAGGYDVENEHNLTLWAMNTFDSVTHSIHKDDMPPSEKVFPVRWVYGNVWSEKRKSIIYWGGYPRIFGQSPRYPVENGVTEFSPEQMGWYTMPIQGTAPEVKYGHCMAANEDGTKIVIYGGRFWNTTLVGELWILDVVNYTWKQGVSGPPREDPVCTIAGDQFLLWGGGSPGNVTSNEVLIYSLMTDSYVTNYVPLEFYKSRVPHATPRRRTSPWEPESASRGVNPGSDSTNNSLDATKNPVGSIVGGTIGGFALAGVMFGIIFWRYTQRNKDGQAQGGRDRMLDANNIARRLHKDPQDTGAKNDNPDFEQDHGDVDKALQELVKQQRELDQQRHLLMQKQQRLIDTNPPDDIDVNYVAPPPASHIPRAPAYIGGAKTEYRSPSPSPPLESATAKTLSSEELVSVPARTPPAFPDSFYENLILPSSAKPTVQAGSGGHGYNNGYSNTTAAVGSSGSEDNHQEAHELHMYGPGDNINADSNPSSYFLEELFNQEGVVVKIQVRNYQLQLAF